MGSWSEVCSVMLEGLGSWTPPHGLVTGLDVSLGVWAGRPGPGDVAWDGVSLGHVGTTATSGSQGSPCPRCPCPALKRGEAGGSPPQAPPPPSAPYPPCQLTPHVLHLPVPTAFLPCGLCPAASPQPADHCSVPSYPGPVTASLPAF